MRKLFDDRMVDEIIAMDTAVPPRNENEGWVGQMSFAQSEMLLQVKLYFDHVTISSSSGLAVSRNKARRSPVSVPGDTSTIPRKLSESGLDLEYDRCLHTF